MHYYQMTIVEETESDYKCDLSLWAVESGDIWIEIGQHGEDDPYSRHGMIMTKDDARALIGELTRLLREVEGNKRIEPGKQLTLTPEIPPSKVNWNR